MLAGLRVLDCTDERGFLAGKILGDLGADVIKLEPPGGDPARRRGPFLGEIEDPERALGWLALNTSKRGITLDLEQSSGVALFRRLLARSDVLLESYAPGFFEEHGLASDLSQEFERLIHCAITPYGRTGPHAALRGHDLTLVAMGGNAALTGPREGPPLRCALPTSHLHAAPEAVLGITLALHHRERTGRGQLVDVSLQECQLTTLLGVPARFALDGTLTPRSGGRVGRTREIWRARDGWVSFGLRGGPARVANLCATVAYMHEGGMAPAWLRDFDWSSWDPAAASADQLEQIERAFAVFFEGKSMRELYEEALRRRILLAPCNDARAILEHPQLRERGLFATLELPGLSARLEHPAFFARSSLEELRLRSRAPRLGEHEAEVYPAVGEEPARPVWRGRDARRSEQGPLGELRVLEFGSGAAGPLASRVLAEHGATVIRVESARRLDFLRLLHSRSNDPNAIDHSLLFLWTNPDKWSVTLDLATERGVALARSLVGWADVVIENFAPGVMARFGLDWESLRGERPALVMVSTSLFGQSGPQRHYPGFGGQGSAIAGFNHLTGLRDGEAHGPYGTITDTLSPRYVALLISAALLERRRSGRGQYLDVAQIEAGIYSLSEMVVRQSASGAGPTRDANRCENEAPHGVYPTAGEDRWIAIAVHSDEEWRRLRHVLGEPAWATDAGLDHLAGRKCREDDLDRRLAEWTAQREGFALMAELQAQGVDAGVVQNAADLLRDPQLAHREHFVPVRHEALGELPLDRCGFRLSACSGSFRTPGPALGAHNTAVLGGVLGLSRAEIDQLVEQGVVR